MGSVDAGCTADELLEAQNGQARLEYLAEQNPQRVLEARFRLDELEEAIQSGEARRIGALAIIGGDVQRSTVSFLEHLNKWGQLGAMLITGEQTAITIDIDRSGGARATKHLQDGYIHNTVLGGGRVAVKNGTSLVGCTVRSNSVLDGVKAIGSTIEGSNLWNTSLAQAKIHLSEGSTFGAELTGKVEHSDISATRSGHVNIVRRRTRTY